MTLKQGAIVIADDQFHHSDKSRRPHIILNNPSHPNHGTYYNCMSVSTKKHGEGVKLNDEFFEYNNLYKESYASPWAVLQIPESSIGKTVAQLKPEAYEALFTEYLGYISPHRTTDAVREAQNTTTTDSQISAD